jgi:hypothetical protein
MTSARSRHVERQNVGVLAAGAKSDHEDAFAIAIALPQANRVWAR